MKMNYLPLSFLLFLSCEKQAPAPLIAPAQSYDVVEISPKTREGYISFPATVEGQSVGQVKTKIAGYIKEVLVDEGQWVDKGQTLFVLEANAINQLKDASKKSVEVAKASVEVAQIEVDKLKALVEKNIISPVQLKTAEVKLLQAKTTYQQAEFNYYSNLSNANDSFIKSPMSGILGEIHHKVGALVSPADAKPLTVVADNAKMHVYFSVNEKQYLNFIEKAKGQNITEKLKNIPACSLELANGSIYEEKGWITNITGQINPNTGSIKFRATFPNAKGILTHGNSAIIRIPKIHENALAVPTSATFEQQGFLYVFKVENDTVKATVVQPTTKIDHFTLLSSGLSKGDKVVISGVSELKSGTVIQPRIIALDSLKNELKPLF